MGRPRHYAFTPESAASNSIAASQAVSGAANLVLTSTYTDNPFPSGMAWNITITSSANISAVNVTIVYLDAQGNQQTVTVAGPNTTTKNAGIYASRVLFVSTSATASNISIGHTVVGYGPWKTLPTRGVSSVNSCSVGIDGTASLTIEGTFANIADNSIFAGTFDYFNTTSINAATASAYDVLDDRLIGCRLKVNSWSSGGIRFDLSVSAKG